MRNRLSIPILEKMIPGGVEYGTNLLVEFQPDSLWYETSFAIAARALSEGIKTDYHTWIRPPKKAREVLARFGLDVNSLERDDVLRIRDSYTTQTGLGEPESPATGTSPQHAKLSRSVKIADLSIAAAAHLKSEIPEADKRRLHIDDNNSVLTQYNEEKAVIDYYRVRLIPEVQARELVAFHCLVTGVHSAGFYKQFESLCEGIIDFKTEEIREGQIEHSVRIRVMRGKAFDSRWHQLHLKETGEVIVAA